VERGAANLVVGYFRGERRNWIWSPEAASMMIKKKHLRIYTRIEVRDYLENMD